MTVTFIFAIWAIAFALLCTAMLFDNKNNLFYKGAVLTFFMVVFLAFALKDRADLFTPVYGLPDNTVEYLYQQHKSKANEEGDIDILLWLTKADSHEEIMYVFPYIGNEEMKKTLDKLRKMIQEKKIGAGPIRFGQMIEGKTEKLPQFENLTRTVPNFNDIKREIE